MTPDNWRDLLGAWSREILAIEEFRLELPPEVVAARWLGYPGATEEAIAAAEERLGMLLPPSYRAFLGVTNGWRTTKTLAGRLLPVGEIAWLRDIDPGLGELWVRGDRAAKQAGTIPSDYLTTGEGLLAALAVSDYHDKILLLIPRDIGPDGEWPGWFFAPWVPGEERSDSFWELMEGEHAIFLFLEQDRPQ